jgi:voltage-gated sodium channel
MKKLFFNDQIIYILILLNVAIIYLHSFEFFSPYYFELDLIDSLFTVFFCIEIAVKISNYKHHKISSYFKDHWNKIDFVSILLSLPSLGALFVHDLEMFAGFTVLRSLRIFKLLRVIEYIPNGKRISEQLFKAFKGVGFIMFTFFVYTTIISLVSLSLFKRYAPEHFSNAFDSFYTIFKIFSGDGFSDVVNAVKVNASPLFTSFTKFYFVFIVFTGSILGLSLINSIFIDQMNQIAREEEDSEEIKLIKELKKELEEVKERLNR